MSQWLYNCDKFGFATNAGATTYAAIGGALATSNTEAPTQLVLGDTFTAKNLSCNVVSITGTCTITDRKNGANGGQAISVTTTGYKEDVTGSTALAPGDLYNHQLVQSATVSDSCSLHALSVVLDDLGAASSPHLLASIVQTWGLGQLFAPCVGSPVNDNNEVATQIVFREATSLSNLTFYVLTNTFAAAVTYRSRVNGANGGQAISVAAGSTGSKTDVTGTDAIVPGDLVAISKDAGGTSGSITTGCIQMLSSDYLALPLISAVAAGQTYSTAAGFIPLGTTVAMGAIAESVAQVHAKAVGLRLINLQVNITLNNRPTTGTVDFRVNGTSPPGAPAVSFTALSTGIKEDLTGAYSPAASDAINARITLEAGSSNLVVLTSVGLQQGIAPPPPLVVFPPRLMNLQKNRKFGPPILVTQPHFQAEGRDRFIDSPAPGQNKLRLAGRFRKGPPILVTQPHFQAEGNDRFLDSPQPGQQKLRIIGRFRKGPPLLNVQQRPGYGADGTLLTLSVSEILVLIETTACDVGQSLLDGLGLSDDAAKEAGQSASESLVFTDSGTTAIDKQVSESIAYTDTNAITDSVALSQNLPIYDNDAKATGKSSSDSISYSESTAKDFSQNLSQALPLNDSESIAIGRAVSESIAYSESRVADLSRALSESIALTETRTADVGKAGSETITLTDAKAAALSVALSQSLVIAEAIAKDIGLATSQPVAFSEALTDAFAVELSEMFSLIDTKAVDLQVAKSQGLTLSEQIALSTLKALSESAVFSDSVLVGRTWHVEPGSFTVTGVDAALRASRKILADPGAYTLTGETARLIAARLIVLGTGRFTETPKAQRFILARAFIAAKGTVTESGKSARLLASRTITAAKGTLQEIGKSMDFVLFGRRTLTAETGRFVLTGKSVQILVGDGRYPATREWLKRGTRHHWDGL